MLHEAFIHGLQTDLALAAGVSSGNNIDFLAAQRTVARVSGLRPRYVIKALKKNHPERIRVLAAIGIGL